MYCGTAARLNTASIVIRLFVKDQSFTLLRDTCNVPKNKSFNTESKEAMDFNT
jgi:hypothetical protein